MNLEGFAVVALAFANFTRNIDVGQEVHFDLDGSVAGTSFAPSAPNVERESTRLIAAPSCIRRLGEEPADVIEHSRVGGGIGARRATDGTLIYVDHFVDQIQALDTAVPARHQAGVAIEFLMYGSVQHVVDER